MEIVANGLRFPEGPVAMADGSVILVEIAAGRITRVRPDGSTQTVAEPGGGPNGLAIGPDGKLYCCNNGGFDYIENKGMLAPHGIARDYSGGRIERIDIATGSVEILYKSGDFGCVLRGPNDIVFDGEGGFWFTDHGKVDYDKRCHDIVGIFYGKVDGSHLEEVIFPSQNPNGVGLSPDGKRLYAAETYVPADGVQRDRPGQGRRQRRPGRPRHPALSSRRVQILRLARRRGERQYLRRDDRRKWHLGDFARRRFGRVRRHRRHLHHQHLLGRGGYDGCLYLSVGDRAPRQTPLAAPGPQAQI
jgi:hypothetical protein